MGKGQREEGRRASKMERNWEEVRESMKPLVVEGPRKDYLMWLGFLRYLLCSDANLYLHCLPIGLLCEVIAKRGFHLYVGTFALRSIYFEDPRAEILHVSHHPQGNCFQWIHFFNLIFHSFSKQVFSYTYFSANHLPNVLFSLSSEVFPHSSATFCSPFNSYQRSAQ